MRSCLVSRKTLISKQHFPSRHLFCIHLQSILSFVTFPYFILPIPSLSISLLHKLFFSVLSFSAISRSLSLSHLFLFLYSQYSHSLKLPLPQLLSLHSFHRRVYRGQSTPSITHSATRDPSPVRSTLSWKSSLNSYLVLFSSLFSSSINFPVFPLVFRPRSVQSFLCGCDANPCFRIRVRHFLYLFSFAKKRYFIFFTYYIWLGDYLYLCTHYVSEVAANSFSYLFK